MHKFILDSIAVGPDGNKLLWNGTSFFPNSKINLYEFSENFDGWSDDLTDLHENVIGSGHPIDIYGRELTVNLIRKFIDKKNINLLEIGCSSGYLIEDIDKYDFINYTGSDIVKGPLVRLSKKYPNNPFVRCDILNSPFIANTFDVVVALNVLEHIENDMLAIEKIYSLLNSDGILILELPFNSDLYDNFDKSLFHFRRYNLVDIHNLSKSSGFKLIDLSYTGILVYPVFYLYKKFFSKILSLKPEKEIAASGNSRLFSMLLILERKLGFLKFFHAGIRIRAVFQK